MKIIKSSRDFIQSAFTGRLNQLLKKREMSQSQLASILNVSRSTVTGWLRYGKLPDADSLARLCIALDCSADWLLGLQTQVEKQDASGTMHWVQEIPAFIVGPQREQIELGVHLFNELVRQNRSAEEIRTHHDQRTVRLALQAALRSGVIRFTQVARSTVLEAQLRAAYPGLKDVIVADVPLHYDDTIIRTEIVAFLAATQLLPGISHENSVGLGSGYTVLRVCEQSIPGIDPFSGTHWIPLLAFAPENTSDYSANYLARLMSVRHPGSQAFYLPHPDECINPHLQSVQQQTLNLQKNLQTILVSVSGVDRRDRSGKAHLLAEFRSADYAAEASDLRQAYASLPDQNGFGGELLRYLLDENGQMISRDPAVGAQIELDILRYNVEMIGWVCVVAARAYKAKAVYTCLKNRLVNALVIDSEIADYLLTAVS